MWSGCFWFEDHDEEEEEEEERREERGEDKIESHARLVKIEP
jgi:hypothetical protein